jgi:hypothetical protein
VSNTQGGASPKNGVSQTVNLPTVPMEEVGTLVAAAVSVMREVVAELVRRKPDADRDAIEAMLEMLAQQADAQNIDRAPGTNEAITRHLHDQVRLMLETIRKPASG